MDQKLVAWALAVKSRRRFAPQIHHRGCYPILWMFTDANRLADPRVAVSRLPKGLCGVVLRHDGVADRAILGRDLARLCRERRLALVVAGDRRLAALLRCGVHLRAGRSGGPLAPKLPRGAFITSSAHDARELRRAAQGGADLAFLSPLLPTASHPGAASLGVVRWTNLAKTALLPVAALGGVSAGTLPALPRRFCCAAGAISAMV
jgi:thiamine-phosphate pyrophosphorylase